MDNSEQVTRNKDGRRNLVRVFHNALQEADTCAGYALDAEAAGNYRFAGFFREVQRMHARVARRAEEMLGMEDARPRSASVRSNATPGGGDPDPGDVTPGQDVA